MDSTFEIELLPFGPNGQSDNVDATQTVFPVKRAVKWEIEMKSFVEIMKFQDDSALLSFSAPAQSTLSLLRTYSFRLRHSGEQGD